MALPGITASGADAWDALPHATGPLGRGYLAAWEQVRLPGLSSRPLVVAEQDGGRLLAAAPAFLYDLDLTPALPAAARRAMRSLARVRVYELGCPVPLARPFLHAADVAPEHAAELILHGARRDAASGGADVLVAAGSAPDDAPIVRALRRQGFAPAPAPPTTALELPFADFDEYLRAMRCRYRRRARRTFERSQHLRSERIGDFGLLAPELARLQRQVFDRAAGVKREQLPPGHFRALAVLDDVTVLALRRPDDSIASFVVLLEDGRRLHCLACGFERRAAHDEAAYFRLIYESIRTAIDGGFDSLELGLTTLGPKLEAGATAVPIRAWIRLRNDLLRHVLPHLAGRFSAAVPPGPYRVFRGQVP